MHPQQDSYSNYNRIDFLGHWENVWLRTSPLALTVFVHIQVCLFVNTRLHFLHHNSPIHRTTGARTSRPFWLPALWTCWLLCYANNLNNGVILSYINDEIKIVAIQKSVLYNDGNLVIIFSTFFSPENDGRKILSRFCKRYLQYYEVRDLFPWEMPSKMMISCLLNVEKIWNSAQINWSSTINFNRKYFFDAMISTEKSTGEIDTDLAQNEM